MLADAFSLPIGSHEDIESKFKVHLFSKKDPIFLDKRELLSSVWDLLFQHALLPAPANGSRRDRRCLNTFLLLIFCICSEFTIRSGVGNLHY